MTPSPILLVAGNALAHLTRLLSLAPVLRDQGHPVIVAAEGARWLALVRDQGYPIIELPLNIDNTALTRGSLALPRAVVWQAVAHDRALLRKLKPRLVVLDWRHSMRLAAAVEGIPVVAIANAQVTKRYCGPQAAPARHPLTRLLGQRSADRLMPIVAPCFFRHWAAPYRAYARAQGHPGWRDLRDYITGDVTLLPDLPSLAPITPDPSYHYIGPLAQYPLPGDALPPLKEPVLYITFGSENAAPYREAVVQTVGDWPGSVVATTGGYPLTWPDHWITRSYVNPLGLAQQYRMAWLFHGGNGTSYQVLHAWQAHSAHFAGVVVAAFNADHQWNAARLAALGAVQAVQTITTLHQPAQQARVCHGLYTLAHHTLLALPQAVQGEIDAYANAPERALQTIRPYL